MSGLTNVQIDLLTFESVKHFLLRKFQVRMQSWNGIMIIPERAVHQFEDTTRGRVTLLPPFQRFAVLKYCVNSPETFNLAFPFICAEDDLNPRNPPKLFIHVIDMPVH